jgi:hypothetical protein
MSIFEFISVMISIVLGVSLAQLLRGIAELAREKSKVRNYGPHVLWTLSLALLHTLLWWSVWDWRELDWNYAQFFVALCEPLVLFFLSTLMLPRPTGETVISMEEHFYEIRVWLMRGWLVFALVVILDGPIVFRNEPLFVGYRIPQLVTAVASIAGMITARPSVQKSVAWIVFLMVVYATSLRFLPGAF